MHLWRADSLNKSLQTTMSSCNGQGAREPMTYTDRMAVRKGGRRLHYWAETDKVMGACLTGAQDCDQIQFLGPEER